MTNLRAWHDSDELKQHYLDRVTEHERLDQFVQGMGRFERGKGCAVACSMHTYNHSIYPAEIGVPVDLAHLQDFIFESLPKDEARKWARRFFAAIEPGADLRLVWDRFTLWILTEEHPDRGEHCARMGALFARRVSGDEPTAEEWDRAAWDAWAARDAWDAWDARAARDAWAARAAWDAWDARAARDAWAARAARDAWDAWDAWAARAAWDARAAFAIRAANKLIELMSAAPVAQ